MKIMFVETFLCQFSSFVLLLHCRHRDLVSKNFPFRSTSSAPLSIVNRRLFLVFLLFRCVLFFIWSRCQRGKIPHSFSTGSLSLVWDFKIARGFLLALTRSQLVRMNGLRFISLLTQSHLFGLAIMKILSEGENFYISSLSHSLTLSLEC